ncbi:MAG: type II toxin-antitoxin system HicB family antitoxin [Chitinophagaceae bacterium]|jgi:predicted RNase H-like HicB family nuclease|nr:type II toxin-antitoxin system HicB family antitoxin [Chitinophagaceae bacterium]
MKITMQVIKGEEFYVGTIKEIPEVITQGKSIAETKENILDALNEYLESMQEIKSDNNVVLEESLTIG